MVHLKSTYKYLAVIVIGLIIFLLDYYELANPFTNEVLLFTLCIAKAAYFIYFVFKTIKDTAHKEFYFHEFMSFAVVSILLVIVSFAIDYYCLFRISSGSFAGTIPKDNIVTEFISFVYYSISVFTTAGFGDIKPNSTNAQVFVSMELMIAFFFTILVIANISHIRSSFSRTIKKHNGYFILKQYIMKKILIATEGGPLTENVVQHGIELAKLLNAEIGFIYAADATGFMGEGGYTAQNYLEDLHKEARELFERLQSEFGINQNWTFIKDGKPAANIVETANEWGADYIVMGTHGRTGISHLLLSSVAEHVIRHSKVPVLVITPQHK